MLWKGRGQSDNVEDRRGGGGGRKLAFGGGLGAVAIAIIALIMGKNPMELLNQVQPGTEQSSTQGPVSETQDEADNREFVGVVLKDTEDVWDKLLRENGMQYQKPKLVMFRGYVESGCGGASSQTGPFYCPADQKVYIDLSFFDEMQNRFSAAGDFARAYVIAHEVGHHVQNLLGTSTKVSQLQQRVSERDANRLSVKLELQADFYAGVWAHHAQQMKNILQDGDIEEALNAAQAIGDDNLQRQAGQRVQPESFTHGTSEQRAYWFRKGFQTGDLSKGNTFDSDI